MYYTPGKFGLEPITEIEYSTGTYEFDTRVVWRRGERLVTARDSGCSCPVPFEGVGLPDLEDVSYTRLRDEAFGELNDENRYPPLTSNAVHEFLEALAKAGAR